MYLNKVFIFGNLTSNPELKALPSGTNVTSFGIATNRVYKGKDGTNQQDTQFHNIVVFGRQAETVAQYMKKGSSVLIEGRIQSRSWDAQDGTKRYRTEIIADRVQFGPRTSGASSGPSADQGQAPAKEKEKAPEEKLDTINYPDEEINTDDIPF